VCRIELVFRQLIYFEGDLKRQFYTEMCQLEGWSVRQLAERAQSLWYCTAHRLARPPHPGPDEGREIRAAYSGAQLAASQNVDFPRAATIVLNVDDQFFVDELRSLINDVTVDAPGKDIDLVIFGVRLKDELADGVTLALHAAVETGPYGGSVPRKRSH
jgi:hypothetical protein